MGCLGLAWSGFDGDWGSAQDLGDYTPEWRISQTNRYGEFDSENNNQEIGKSAQEPQRGRCIVGTGWVGSGWRISGEAKMLVCRALCQ
jgi:hypothetical protein